MLDPKTLALNPQPHICLHCPSQKGLPPTPSYLTISLWPPEVPCGFCLPPEHAAARLWLQVGMYRGRGGLCAFGWHSRNTQWSTLSNFETSSCNHPGKNEALLKSIGLLALTVEIMVPKRSESLQDSHAGRRKMLRSSASQRRNLSSRKRFHAVLTTCYNILQEGRSKSQAMMGRTSP